MASSTRTNRKIIQNKEMEVKKKEKIRKYINLLNTFIQKSSIIITCFKSLNVDIFSIKIISIIFIILSIVEILLSTYYNRYFITKHTN